jgi:hypothetical protein
MPPAGCGIMIVTGRLGQVCDEAAEGSSNATTAATKTALQMRGMKCVLFLKFCVR